MGFQGLTTGNLLPCIPVGAPGGHLARKPAGGSVRYFWVKCLPKVTFLDKIFVNNDIFGSYRKI